MGIGTHNVFAGVLRTFRPNTTVIRQAEDGKYASISGIGLKSVKR